MRCVVLLVLCTACCSAFATTARVAPVISTAVPLSARRPALQNPSAPAVRRQRLGASAGGARGVAMSLRGGTVAALVLAPHWTSLLPPLATIVVSLAAKQVVLALLAGLWAGAWLLHGNPLVAFLRSVDTYALEAMADPEHAGILIFTLLLGGAIGVIQKTGGSLGLARAFGPLARTRKRAAATTFGLSSLIFFDDYSSVLIVGNSLRKPIAAAGLSLQKFALIVHAMATCVASLSPVSSWTGLQLGYVAGAVAAAGLSGQIDGFSMMLATIPYRLLPMLFIALIGYSIVSGKDIGAVADAEALSVAGMADPSAVADPAEVEGTGPLDPKPGTPLRMLNALIPFGAIIVTAFAGMLIDGAIKLGPAAQGAGIFGRLAACDSVRALIWASLAGTGSAVGLALAQRILTVQEALTAWMDGMKEVLEPCVILTLAWALGAVIADVKAAAFLASMLQGGLPQWALPPLLSLVCYAMSYATGSAAGTMGVVFPLAAPLAASLSGGNLDFVKNCFGAILGSSLFGNICSPIADTTIMTSLSTKISVPAHVAGITPYTALVGAVAVGANLLLSLGLVGPAGATFCGLAALGVASTRFRSAEPNKLRSA